MVRWTERWRSAAAGFMLWLPMGTGTLKAMIRYQAANVPLIVGVAEAVSGARFRMLLMCCMALMAIEALLFGMGIGHY